MDTFLFIFGVSLLTLMVACRRHHDYIVSKGVKRTSLQGVLSCLLAGNGSSAVVGIACLPLLSSLDGTMGIGHLGRYLGVGCRRIPEFLREGLKRGTFIACVMSQCDEFLER